MKILYMKKRLKLVIFLISDFKFIKQTTGKITLMAKSYTYYRDKISYGTVRWRCSSTKKNKCRSFVITNKHEDGSHRVIKMQLDHTHDAPNLTETHDGKYSNNPVVCPWQLPSPARLAEDIMTTASVVASMLPKFNY